MVFVLLVLLFADSSGDRQEVLPDHYLLRHLCAVATGTVSKAGTDHADLLVSGRAAPAAGRAADGGTPPSSCRATPCRKPKPPAWQVRPHVIKKEEG